MNTAVLFVTFNRLEYVKATLAAIAKAKPPRLYVASDGPRPNVVGEDKIVNSVRSYILSHVDWPCEVKTRFLDVNSGGCKPGVTSAFSWFFEKEKEGIIIEDDVVADTSFFSYAEALLDKYRDDKRIWMISGEAPIDVDIPSTYYFSKCGACWGWASWSDRWRKFSTDIPDYEDSLFERFSGNKLIQSFWRVNYDLVKRNELDSWDFPWYLLIAANNGLCAIASHSLTTNIGAEGVHYTSGANDGGALFKPIVPVKELVHPSEVDVDEELEERMYHERFRVPLEVIKGEQTIRMFKRKLITISTRSVRHYDGSETETLIYRIFGKRIMKKIIKRCRDYEFKWGE